MDAKRAANIASFKLCIEREMNGGEKNHYKQQLSEIGGIDEH